MQLQCLQWYTANFVKVFKKIGNTIQGIYLIIVNKKCDIIMFQDVITNIIYTV